MADLFSPAKFDYEECRIKTAGTGDAIDPKHIAVDPASDNLITNDPALGLKVVADDLISAEEGNVAKKSQADGGILVKPADMVSSDNCNALDLGTDGKLRLRPEDLISDVNGGNPLGINPEDCKLFINPCLLPGPQNIVSNDEGNLIVRDPDDCSALLKYQNVVSEDAGNLIEPGTDGKLKITVQDIVDKGYIGAGLVYVERQDGSHVLQVAACNGLTFNEGDKTDVRGNTYHAKWLSIDLDDNQNLLYFVSGDGCTECFEGCGQLSIEFSMNANGQWLRILDRNGNVYKRISLNNGLTASNDGGLTINTLDTLDRNNDAPISSKAVVAYAAPKYHANADKTIYGGGTGTLYGHVKLSAAHDSTLGVDDSVAATPSAVKKAYDDGTRQATGAVPGQVTLSSAHDSDLAPSAGVAATPAAVKKAYDDGTRKGTCSQFGQVKLTDSLTSTDGCADSVGLSAKAGKQLKDLIDQIVGPDDPDDPGASDARKAIYELHAKNFASTGSGRSTVVYGQVFMPRVNGKRLNGHLVAYTGTTTSGDVVSVKLTEESVTGKTSGQNTGYYVSIALPEVSASDVTAFVNALNTAAGTNGIPFSELAHYRVTNAVDPADGGSHNNTYFFVAAKTQALALDFWTAHGTSTTADTMESSKYLTQAYAVPYTKAYYDVDAS